MMRRSFLAAAAAGLAGCVLDARGHVVSPPVDGGRALDRRWDRPGPRRGSSGGGAPASPWTLAWDSDDAVFSGSSLTAWPPRIGSATMTIDATQIPTNLGRAANGHVPVTFAPSATIEGGRLYTADTDGLGTGRTEYTCEVAYRPCDVDGNVYANGAADRAYLLYFENDSVSSPDHHVVSHIANSAGFDDWGTYIAGSWKISTIAPPTNRLQVTTLRVRADGSIVQSRNGITIDDTLTWTPSTIALQNIVIGMAYPPGIAGQFRGNIYSIRLTPTALSDGEVLAQAEERIARYTIPTSTWTPASEASLRSRFDEHGIRLVAASTKIDQWRNRGLSSPVVAAQNTDANRPLLGRSGGLLCPVFDGTNDRLISTNNPISVGGYEMIIGFEPAALPSQTTSVGLNGAVMWGDTLGYTWLSLRNNSGSIEARVGHWTGAEQSITLTGITAGARHVIHMWYDGTTIRARLDAGSEQTRAAANVLGVAGAANLGGRTDATSFNGKIFHFTAFNAALSSGSRTSLRQYVSEETGIAL
jgi:hypothetical protein